VVDIVRFLGSIDLVARRRSWEKDRNTLFDRFVEGYKRGLAEPAYLPPPPTSCAGYAPRRHRHARRFSRGERARCNRWGYVHEGGRRAMEAVARVVLRERTDPTPEYFRVIRAGSVKGGVGSAVSPKIMVRVRGRPMIRLTMSFSSQKRSGSGRPALS